MMAWHLISIGADLHYFALCSVAAYEYSWADSRIPATRVFIAAAVQWAWLVQLLWLGRVTDTMPGHWHSIHPAVALLCLYTVNWKRCYCQQTTDVPRLVGHCDAVEFKGQWNSLLTTWSQLMMTVSSASEWEKEATLCISTFTEHLV